MAIRENLQESFENNIVYSHSLKQDFLPDRQAGFSIK